MASARRWQPERPEIRASDAERERVVSFLRDTAAEGRLTADELDERVGDAYAAVTRGELRRLVSDLPDPPVERRRSAQRIHPAWSPGRRGGIAVVGLGALMAMRLHGVALLLVLMAFALTITLVALIAALAVAVSPFVALVVLTVMAVRRRGARSCVRGH